MKQILLFIVVFLCGYSVNGQILNGSFENDSAPDLSYWKSTCYDAESISNTPPGGGNWSIVVLGGNYLGCFPGYAYQKIPTITNGQTFLLHMVGLLGKLQTYILAKLKMVL